MTMKDVIEIVDKNYIGFGKDKVINPTKVGLDLGETAAWPPYKGFMNAMPAYVGWLDSAGIKWAGGFLDNAKVGLPYITGMILLINPKTLDNAKVGLPYITGMILLINPKTGQFKAVMDGAEITNMRTGVQTAVALKYLYEKKYIKIGLYGAGMQGHFQTKAISQLFDIEELKVYDIKREASEKFADDMKDIVAGNIKIVDSLQEAADGDAVICVTQSKEKFVKNDWIKPGTILFTMGSYQECEDEFILSADKIIVDHIGQCLHRGALKELNEKGKITKDSIYATIGEVAAGKKRGRDSEKDRILCIPIGIGAMDVAVATVVYQRAVEKGIGGEFKFN